MPRAVGRIALSSVIAALVLVGPRVLVFAQNGAAPAAAPRAAASSAPQTAPRRAAQSAAQPAPAPRTAPAAGTPGAAPSAPEPDPARMEKLLKLWEAQSAKLKTLDVWIYRVDRIPGWGEDHYEGRAVFKSPQLAFLKFDKITMVKDAKGKRVPAPNPKDPKKRLTVPQETIICGGDDVWQYLYPVKQIFVYPLAREQRQRALDEGPLPFLFNMRADRARERYDMSLMGENEKYYSVKIVPRLAADKEAFSVARIVLDKQWLLPVRVSLISPDKKSSKDFMLEHINPNAAVNDAWFQGRPLKGWKLIEDPDASGRPRAKTNANTNVGAAARGRPAAATAGRAPSRPVDRR